MGSSATWTYSPTHIHQVTEAGSTAYEYAYDANGNMTSWTGEPITWTSYNYPSRIVGASSTFTFSYAPDRSVWLETETGGAGNTTYRLGSPLMSIVRGSSGTTDRNYIYAGSEPVAIDERTSSSNTIYYLLTDHQGSISGITNSAGQVVVDESFHPYGERRNPAIWADPISTSDLNTIQGITPRGYTFKETLQYMNLVDLGGRIENSVIGRFLSADPNIPDPTDPQSYNRYSYTRNNPLTYTDPTGFDDTATGQNTNSGGGGIADFDHAIQIFGDSLLAEIPDLSSDGSQSLLQSFMSNDLDSGDFGNLGLNSSDLGYLGLGSANSGNLGGIRGVGEIGGAQQSNQPLTTCNNGDSPCLNEVTVNGYRTIVPDNVFQAPTVQNFNFDCGGLRCVFQMGPYVPSNGTRGVYLNLSVASKNNGKWVQTWVATDSPFTTDNASNPSSPLYTPDWSNGTWFFDDPSRPPYWLGTTWLAQVSYVTQSGAAFTLQWGFTFTNGSATPIAPLLVTQPWAPQQTLINKAQGAP